MKYWRKEYEKKKKTIEQMKARGLLPNEEIQLPTISGDLEELNDRVEDALVHLGIHPSCHVMAMGLMDTVITEEISRSHKGKFEELERLMISGLQKEFTQKKDEIRALATMIALQRIGVETHTTEAHTYARASALYRQDDDNIGEGA